MDTERWQRIQTLFEAALDRPLNELHGWLDEACSSQPELKHEVLSLLAADTEDRVGGIVSDAARAALDAEDGAMAGRRVGAYRIEREIGRGGMGAVYLAERVDGQFEQCVAIKVVRERLARPDLVERFRDERRILARLEHPNIARLLDGGTTDEGSPYVIMEYVEGSRLDVYCERKQLPLSERLQLFLGVCDAVRYAHRNLIVHRDLKPANVLVTAEGTPKLLDFGIARLLDPSGGSDVAATQTAARLLTPEYASPEQLRGEPVSTVSDVYSLGVMLYELLTQRRPFVTTETVPGELERAVLDQEPARPSAAVTDTQPPFELQLTPRALKGDLDNIVLMALRKEPERRYSSVRELAEDIRRYLDGMPIRARASTWSYRSGKFIRRHKLGVAAVALTLIGLVGGGLAATVGLVRALAAEKRATASGATSERVIELLVDLFESGDPRENLGQDVTVRDLLDRGRDRLQGELEGEPEIQGRLFHVLGTVEYGMGNYPKAEELFRHALDSFTAGGENTAGELVPTLGYLGRSMHGQGRYEEALETLRQTLDDATAAFGADDPRVIAPTRYVGATLNRLRRYDEAETTLRSALELAESSDSNWQEAVNVMKVLAIVRWRLDDMQGSLDLEQRAIALLESRDPDNVLGIAGLRANMATSLAELERFDEAAEALQIAITARRTIYPIDHPDLLTSEMNVGILLSNAGDHDEAFRTQNDVFQRRLRVLGPDHPDTALSAYNLSVHWSRVNDVDRSLTMLRDAVDRGLVRTIPVELPPFDSVRDNPEFQRLVAIVHSRR